jgi:hypothetical protein
MCQSILSAKISCLIPFMSDFKNKKAVNTYFLPLFGSKLRSPDLIARFRWFS